VAVALATGMGPLGLGNDGLRSLRHSAQCRGISVLQPGPGRIPDATTVAGPQVGAIGAQLVTVNGPLARRTSP
jgi:amidase